jgi:ribonucleoside-diphosphate reductase subunit M2
MEVTHKQRNSSYTILTKDKCVYCDKAKALLESRGIAYETIECESIQDAIHHLGPLAVKMRQFTTFPIIFKSDTGAIVGGYANLRDQLEEPLLQTEDEGRFSLFPLVYPDLYDLYKKAVASFWVSEEVNLKQDVSDWETLTSEEKYFLKMVLAFFASADGIVQENLASRFCNEVGVAEARAFYAYQIYNESIHSEMYGLLIDALIKDPQERQALFQAITTIPCVAQKAAWALQWLDPSRRFAERLVAFACVEGILFSGSFCSIFWLKQRGKMPGLSLSNQFISRDENLHQVFATSLYRHLRHQLTQQEVENIVRGAVDAEKAFIIDAIPCSLVGMNSKLMIQYIEYVSDRLLNELGYAKMFYSLNPFPWMEQLSLSSTAKTNFFEHQVSEYARASVIGGDTSFTFSELTNEAF